MHLNIASTSFSYSAVFWFSLYRIISIYYIFTEKVVWTDWVDVCFNLWFCIPNLRLPKVYSKKYVSRSLQWDPWNCGIGRRPLDSMFLNEHETNQSFSVHTTQSFSLFRTHGKTYYFKLTIYAQSYLMSFSCSTVLWVPLHGAP